MTSKVTEVTKDGTIHRHPQHLSTAIVVWTTVVAVLWWTSHSSWDAGRPLVSGDFNLPAQDNTAGVDTRRLISVLSSFDMVQHVNSPTHRCGNTLHLVVTFADRPPTTVIVQPPGAIADHSLVVSQLTHRHRLNGSCVGGGAWTEISYEKHCNPVGCVLQSTRARRWRRPAVRHVQFGTTRHCPSAGAEPRHSTLSRPSDAVVRL